MQFFCQKCETNHNVANGQAAICDVYDEIVAERIPDNQYWCFCCGCQTFWRLDQFGAKQQTLITSCIVCDRSIIKSQVFRKRTERVNQQIVSYLCHQCNTVSVQTADVAKGVLLTLNASLLFSFRCPGCGNAMGLTRTHHNCSSVGLTLTTSRSECCFCGEALNPEPLTDLLSSLAAEAAKPEPRLEIPKVAHNVEARRPAISEVSPTAAATLPGAKTPSQSSRTPLPTKTASISLSTLVHRQSFNRTTLLIIIVCFTACMFLIGHILLAPDTSRAGNPTEMPDTTELVPSDPVIPQPPEGMVYVPGGAFWMGSDTGDKYEKPRHEVNIPPFFIDRLEVTNREYALFVGATTHRAPPHWRNGMYDADEASRPVTGVDWHDANAYANWAGKRLPTEAEWEFAARGTDGRLYPWGNSWKENVANADATSKHQIIDVGTLPDGVSPFGVLDLIGNAWEWTADSIQAYPGNSLPINLSQDYKIIRGGSWKDSKETGATATYRGYLHVSDSQDYSVTGFRCVKDVSRHK